MRAFAVAVVLLAAAPAAAQPMDTYGMGSRSIALGGAVTADVEDFTANYYNPAGVVRDGQLRFGVGWFGAVHDMTLNDESSNVDPVHGIVAGLNVPGNIGDFRFAFGLALHLNDQRVSRTRVLPRMRPRWELYDNRPQRTYLATHVAIEPWPWLRIGGGVGFLSYSEVDLSIRGEIDIGAPERGSALDHDVLANLVTIRFPQVGIQVQPTEWLDFGVVYRGEYALTSELYAQVGEPDGTGPNAAGLLVGDTYVPAYLQLLSASTGAYVPHQISFGASVRPIPQLRIAVEVTWLMWSLYQSPIGLTELELRVTLPPELAGTIVIPPLANTLPVAAGFSDRVVPRLGVEWTAHEDTDLRFDLRVGYFYENSPAPEQSGAYNLVDTDRHAWSAGAGLELRGLRPLLPGSLRFDLHLQYGFLPARRMVKLSPIDPTGDYVASGHIFAGGLTMEVRFE
ncbi:MAG: outer membrane protein transport protein [Sandaracinaceae bacterium]|nr:outer membrane protein transport protein [Sandaracinaceae bacterium]